MLSAFAAFKGPKMKLTVMTVTEIKETAKFSAFLFY